MFKQLQAELALAHNIHFNDVSLLEEALTQANYINEHPNYTGRDYQRLEFLGDAVMQQSTAVYLFKRYPDWDEGRLTELRISMVQTRAFAALSRELHLDQYVQLGRGEELSGARNRDSLLEDLWEAFIGALYLDQGQEVVMNFLGEIMFTKIDEGFYDQFVDYKSKLQEHLQRHGTQSYLNAQLRTMNKSLRLRYRSTSKRWRLERESQRRKPKRQPLVQLIKL